jgi:hypothetical protein
MVAVAGNADHGRTRTSHSFFCNSFRGTTCVGGLGEAYAKPAVKQHLPAIWPSRQLNGISFSPCRELW